MIIIRGYHCFATVFTLKDLSFVFKQLSFLPKPKNSSLAISGQNRAADLTEVGRAHHDSVAVENELSFGAVGHLDGLGAAPRNFQHGTEGALLRTADRAARHHVAGAEVAAVDCVVGELLTHVPIHVTEIGTADHLA